MLYYKSINKVSIRNQHYARFNFILSGILSDLMARKEAISELDTKDELMLIHIVSEGCNETVYGGYKKEIITQKLSVMENTFVVCSKCAGIMRDATSIRSGLGMMCEVCIGEEEVTIAAGTVRGMVLKLGCRCPLKQRGCDWEGELGSLAEHLDECSHFIVPCPFLKYGCKKKIKRLQSETHRTEDKDYHAELVSVFMAEKVERLEMENKEHTEVIMKLEKNVNFLLNRMKYDKLNGVVWNMGERNEILTKLLKLKYPPKTENSPPLPIIRPNSPYSSQPNSPYSSQPNSPRSQRNPSYLQAWSSYSQPKTIPQIKVNNLRPCDYSKYKYWNLDTCEDDVKNDKHYCQWSGNICEGPRFLIHSMYELYPNLDVSNSNTVTLNLATVKKQNSMMSWPIQGRWEVFLVGKEDADIWGKEISELKINNGGTVKLIDIPSDVLIDEKFNHNGTIVMEIFFKAS